MKHSCVWQAFSRCGKDAAAEPLLLTGLGQKRFEGTKKFTAFVYRAKAVRIQRVGQTVGSSPVDSIRVLCMGAW